MEMNTRLQVEHTVTEAITGLDLVEWQLRIAAGEALPLTQAEVRFNGHALEARVCAEDPEQGFLPSSGELALMEWPRGEGVRVDAGFDSADRVPDCYDSLLGKVIAWAPQREEACARLAAALDQTLCAGVRSNERYLARVLRAPQFLDAAHSIAFLEQAAAQLVAPAADEALVVLAALVMSATASGGAAPLSPWELRDGFTPNLPASIPLTLSAQERSRRVELTFERGRPVGASLDAGTALALAEVRVGRQEVVARLNERSLKARYLRLADRVHLWAQAAHLEVRLDDPRERQFTSSAAQGGLTTPLPGVVVSVPVALGQGVEAGAVLMVIEAMKMEHAITAPYAGVVSAIHFAPGERVPEGSELLELKRD
jgi:3-methylcrotonyl-CoA carboxylase alpha subunit